MCGENFHELVDFHRKTLMDCSLVRPVVLPKDITPDFAEITFANSHSNTAMPRLQDQCKLLHCTVSVGKLGEGQELRLNMVLIECVFVTVIRWGSFSRLVQLQETQIDVSMHNPPTMNNVICCRNW